MGNSSSRVNSTRFFVQMDNKKLALKLRLTKPEHRGHGASSSVAFAIRGTTAAATHAASSSCPCSSGAAGHNVWSREHAVFPCVAAHMTPS